jgi:hypothetical protein
MERAGRLIGKLKINAKSATPEELARAAWPGAVGRNIAAHTAVAALVRTSLIVEVEDALWQRQLNTLRNQIVRRMQDVMGAMVVTEIAFRPMIPKRMPQRAELVRSTYELKPDDADKIADAVLRHIYKTSRKKATA